MNETLNDYWISDTKWCGNDLEVTLTPYTQPKYTVRVTDKFNIDKVFELMKDRDHPVRSFTIDNDCKIIFTEDTTISFASIKNEGK